MKNKIIVWNILITLLVIVSIYSTVPVLSSSSEGVYATDHIVINEICYNTTTSKTVWFELYNPTNQSINITGWLLFFYSWDGYTYLPYIHIESGEYVIICAYRNETQEYWKIPENVRVLELGMHFWGAMWDAIHITDGGATLIDRVGFRVLPSTSVNHSWARYRGGYDTDKFGNDFYDEPDPTPGCENRRWKWEPSDVDKYINPPIKVDRLHDGIHPSLIQTQNGSFMMAFVSLTGLYESWTTYDIRVTTSNDAINWTKSKWIFDTPGENSSRDFPSLIQLQNGTFMISYRYYDEEDFLPMTNHSIRIITSKDGVNWSAPIKVTEDYNMSCYNEVENGILLPRIATRLYQMDDSMLVIGRDPHFCTSWSGMNWTKEENQSNIQTFKELTKDKIKTLKGKYMCVATHVHDISDTEYNLTGMHIRFSEDGKFWSNSIQITGNDTSNLSLIQAKDGRYIVAFTIAFTENHKEPYVVIFEDSDLTVAYPFEDLFFTYLIIAVAVFVLIVVSTALLLRRRMKRK